MKTTFANPLHDLNVLLMHLKISNNLSATLGLKPEYLSEDLIVHWRLKYDPGMPTGWAHSHVANMYLDLLKNKLVVSTFHPNVLKNTGFLGLIKPCIKIAEEHELVIDIYYDKRFYDDACGCPSCIESFDEFMSGSSSSLKLVWDTESSGVVNQGSLYVQGNDTQH